MGDKFNLIWHAFKPHGRDLLKNLIVTQEFADVTLVSEDQHQYNVHKLILSAYSTVFKNILNSNPVSTSIYLMGVHHDELESILKFIYLGEATFHQKRVNELLNLAMNLDIKGINKNVIEGKYMELNYTAHAHVEEDNTEEIDDRQRNKESIPIQSSRKIVVIGRKVSKSLLACKKIHKCNDCAYQTKYHADLHRHMRAKHDGIKMQCQQCDYQTTRAEYLQHDSNSKHKGIKYPCQQCDFQATYQGGLLRHVKTQHEGIKYPCKQCDFQANYQASLLRHVKTQHEGITYQCKHCDHKATRKDHLQLHIKSKHEGLTFPCQQCDYLATFPSALKHHVKVKH